MVCGGYLGGFFPSLAWFSVTTPKLFQEDTIARRVAGLAGTAAKEMLVKPQPEMEQGCVNT